MMHHRLQKWIKDRRMTPYLQMGVGLCATSWLLNCWFFNGDHFLKGFPAGFFFPLHRAELLLRHCIPKIYFEGKEALVWRFSGTNFYWDHHMSTKCIQTGFQTCKTGTVFWKTVPGSAGVKAWAEQRRLWTLLKKKIKNRRRPDDCKVWRENACQAGSFRELGQRT